MKTPQISRWPLPVRTLRVTLVILFVPMLVLSLGCSAESADSAETAAPPQSATEDAPAVGDAESTPAQDDSMHNTLRWQTASEVDNFGFDVFRADTEDGPFAKVNEDPIAGAGTVDEPQQYVFVDRTNDPKRDYYYYVESISMANEREHFTPVLKAKAKQPAKSSED